MAGIGTIINAAAVLGGGVLGTLGGKCLSERFQRILNLALGLGVCFLGLQMVLRPFVHSLGHGADAGAADLPDPLVTVGALVAGSVLGELLRIEQNLERLGHWLQERAPGRTVE